MNDPLRKKLHARLDEMFEQHHVVVWHDPSNALVRVLSDPGVLPEDVTMPPYEGNPLSLRRQIDTDDPWLEKKWLLYVPALPEGVVCEWLADYEQGFCHVAEGSLCACLHTFFDLTETPSLRAALVGPAAEELALRFGEYLPHVAASLREEELVRALLRAAIRAPMAEWPELLVRYVTSAADRSAWDAAGLSVALTSAIRDQLGLRRHLVPGQRPDIDALCRCMVASALVMSGAADGKLLANHLSSEDRREVWMAALQQGLADSERGRDLTRAIDQALSSSDLPNAMDNPERLARGPALDLVDRRIEHLLLARRPADPLNPGWCTEVSAVAETRLAHKGLQSPIRERWGCIRAAADLVVGSRRRLVEIETYPAEAFDRLAREYVDGKDGDWQLDRTFRLLPQAEDRFGADWAPLLRAAQQEYFRWVRTQTSRFTKGLVGRGKYAAGRFIQQTELWETLVEGEGSVAVLCVDALRADLAYELATLLERRQRKVEPQPVLAQLPTRTEVGMAALLPRAHGNFALMVEEGRLIAAIDGTRLPGVEQRKKHLSDAFAKQKRSVERAHLKDFLHDGGALLSACLRGGTLPVAHTTDIDEGGPMAAGSSFAFFKVWLEECAAFTDLALSLGFSRVIIASDHGFLVRAPHAAKVGVPGIPPSGGGFCRGVRYAAGNVDCGDALVKLSAKLLGREGADVYVPHDDGYIEAPGGAGLFIHGGLSPQECALVFLRVTPGSAAPVKRYVPLALRADDHAASLAFKVAVVADAISEPIGLSGRKVVVRIVDEKGALAWPEPTPEVFYPGPARTKAFTPSVPRGGQYELLLVDADTGDVIARRSIQVDVLGDDFGF